jgi:uncharacterized membrane protein YfcA
MTEFLSQNIDVLLLLAFAGCVAGLLAGLFGVGGGLVVVPVVFFVLQGQGVDPALAMSIAVSTSLATIVPTAISSVRAHHTLGNVDWQLVKQIAPGLLLGVLVGSQLVAHIRSTGFVVFFGIFLLLIAANLLWRGSRKPHLAQLPAIWIQAALAALVGGISAVAGVGGGALGVPLLTAASVPVHRAIGTCAAFGLLIASLGAVSILATADTPVDAPSGTWRLIYLPALFTLVPLTVLMAPRGAALGKRLSPELLRKLFAGVLVLTSARMLYSAWAG